MFQGGEVSDGSELIGPAEPFLDFLADSLSDCGSEGRVGSEEYSSQFNLIFEGKGHLPSYLSLSVCLCVSPQFRGISVEQMIGPLPVSLNMEVKTILCVCFYIRCLCVCLPSCICVLSVLMSIYVSPPQVRPVTVT